MKSLYCLCVTILEDTLPDIPEGHSVLHIYILASDFMLFTDQQLLVVMQQEMLRCGNKDLDKDSCTQGCKCRMLEMNNKNIFFLFAIIHSCLFPAVGEKC